MIYFTQAELEHLLTEDVPYHDETTHALGIDHNPGWLEIHAREADSVLCGTEEISRMAELLGLSVVFSQPSGYRPVQGEAVFKVSGAAGALHKWWRVAVVLLSYASGVASQTRRVLDAVQTINPALHIATTRKTPPGNRKIMIKAVLTGGGAIHRLGLSESILVFAQHRAFLPPSITLTELVKKLRAACPEKRIMLEAESVAEATEAAYARADIVQCDKLSPEILKELVPKLKIINPKLIISAAGGITPDNATKYAMTGVDLLVTSSVYHAMPADFNVTMRAK
jgi:molybdenum transport protein